jgi:hypothetical protein
MNNSAQNALVDEVERLIASTPDRHFVAIDNALLGRLGCPPRGFLTSMPEYIQWREQAPPPAKKLELITLCLPKLFTAKIFMFHQKALFAGLSRHNCWKQCLCTEESTRIFAFRILSFIETYLELSATEKALAPHIAKILSGWLSLPDSIAMPGPITVCRNLFGNAWCSFFLPEDAIDDLGKSWMLVVNIADIVARERPPFLPGLCPAQERQLVMSLPELDINL